MTTAQYDIISSFTDDLTRDSRTLAHCHGTVGFVRACFVVMRGERLSRKALDVMRTSLAICGQACESGVCMHEAYKRVKKIRDQYQLISCVMTDQSFPIFLRRQVNTSLAEWDDLAEDCLVGGDTDIRKALNDIATRI